MMTVARAPQSTWAQRKQPAQAMLLVLTLKRRLPQLLTLRQTLTRLKLLETPPVLLLMPLLVRLPLLLLLLLLLLMLVVVVLRTRQSMP